MNRYDQVNAVARYDPPNFVDPGPAPIVRHEPAPLQIGDMLQQRAAVGPGQGGDALNAAKGMLVASFGYSVAGLMITAGLVLLASVTGVINVRVVLWLVLLLIAWGAVWLLSLVVNHALQLRNSGPGVQHHEIASRERIAREALRLHAELLRMKWGLDE